ncbi:MAG TPA: hypothetical protein VG892_11370, partial [Terriglobales bacterium]|nr:hypothetical protein [Terriglobales bacterium]
IALWPVTAAALVMGVAPLIWTAAIDPAVQPLANPAPAVSIWIDKSPVQKTQLERLRSTVNRSQGVRSLAQNTVPNEVSR